MNNKKFAIIIPVYNHEQQIVSVITSALQTGIPIFVVDDGSTDSSYHKIKDIKGISVLRHKKNQGKGAAIMTGFHEAAKIADWGITLDADGQHPPEDIVNLIQAIPDNTRPVIVVGKREGMGNKNVPWTSRFGRKFSNFWVSVSGGPLISDSQSGFRIYPLPESMNLNVKGKRFQFEVEILVRAEWKNIPVIETPVSVIYDKDKRVSHFRPFIDFLRNSMTFTQLIFQRIFIPSHIRRRFLAENPKYKSTQIRGQNKFSG